MLLSSTIIPRMFMQFIPTNSALQEGGFVPIYEQMLCVDHCCKVLHLSAQLLFSPYGTLRNTLNLINKARYDMKTVPLNR